MAPHLTADERELISQMRFAKATQGEIAKRLKRDRSTIYREVRRNSVNGRYGPIQAQRLAETRHRWARRQSRKMNRPEIREYVFERLRRCWSPDQIAGRLRLTLHGDRQRYISAPTIYAFLKQELFRCWRPYLRGGSRRRGRPRTVPRDARIGHRPEIINARQRFGDWEGDTMLGSQRRRDGALVVLVERRSGYLELSKVLNRQSSTVMRAIRRQLERHPADLRRSCTFDNGSEFAEHAELKKQLGLETYFADPHCPWQRGTNEHTIRLVRQFIPKGKSLRGISHREVARIADDLNDRPRKRLGYRTPREAFLEECCRAFQT